MPRAATICIVRPCGRLTTNGPRCTEHELEQQRHRNAARGERYGAEHRAERERWAPLVAAGVVTCARANERRDCPGLIAPGEPWHLDHLDDGTQHPSHPPCNEGARANATPDTARRR